MEIYRQYGLNTKVVPVTTEEYGLSKAVRPYNSRLDKGKLVENGFELLPDWSAYILYILLYAILFAFVTVLSGRFCLGNSIAMAFLFAVTVIDYQVYFFRGTEILPGDVLSFRTALGVAGQYHPQITINMVVAVLLLLLYLILLNMLVKFRLVK